MKNQIAKVPSQQCDLNLASKFINSQKIQIMDDKYQCHICMELANKPVVTPCGHLFCWPCIYHWLRSNQQYLTCPICKSGLDISSLRPILDPTMPPQKAQNGIPPRPKAFRKSKKGRNLKEIPKSILNIGMNVQRGVFLAGYGLFPSTYMGLCHEHLAPEMNQSLLQPEGREYKVYKVLQKAHVLLWILVCVIVVFLL